MYKRPSARAQIAALKKRRDALLNQSCNRQERVRLLAEVVEINQQVCRLERALTGR